MTPKSNDKPKYHNHLQVPAESLISHQQIKLIVDQEGHRLRQHES
jgi:hypothetical protein